MSELELKTITDGINRAVEEIRTETKMTAESQAKAEANLASLIEQKTALETRLSALETATQFPGAAKSKGVDEHKAAFVEYLRKSNDRSVETHLREVETKGFVSAAPSNGGYAVPTVIGAEIARIATNISPLRGLIRSVSASTTNYTEVLSNANAGTGWVGETATRTATATPTLSRVSPTFGELYAVAEVSNFMLNDAFFDVEAWLVTEIAEKFAAAENIAFLTGNGTDKPTGLLNGTVITGPASGEAADFGANPFDNILDLRYAVAGEYAQRGTFLMNSTVLARLAKVKDDNGAYIYQPTVAAGVADTLLGKPLVLDENMPNIAAGSRSILFGDFSRAYLAVDIVNMSIITDNVSNKGHTQFYVSKRLGGAVKDANAVKALRIAAT